MPHRSESTGLTAHFNSDHTCTLTLFFFGVGRKTLNPMRVPQLTPRKH